MKKNQSKNTDALLDTLVAEGLDTFNGELHLFKDKNGYWIENWRTAHYSDYLKDDNGKVIQNQAKALECFERERINTQFSQAIYP